MTYGYGRPAWQNPRLIGALALVFLCGAMSGAVAMRLLHRHATGTGRSSLDLTTLNEQLHLSADQSSQISQALDDYGKYMADLQSQMRDVKAQGLGRIKAILTDEQRAKFERMSGELQGRGSH